jgi:acetyl esterase/lipase
MREYFFYHKLQSITINVLQLIEWQCRHKKMLLFALFLHCGLLYTTVSAQQIYQLYEGNVPAMQPNTKQEVKTSGMYSHVTAPALEVFLPESGKANGTAVIICPGGGYSVIVYDGEGVTVAKRLTEKGVTVFVLKYRLPDDVAMLDKKTAPLQDAQESIRFVREHADKWNIDPNKIGIMGFSAGGHLASTAATHFTSSFISNSKKTSLRPDFQVLIYPVISMQDGLTHNDSRKKLLGEQPSKEIKDKFSGELNVTAQTPPLYITHASDDKLVDVRNSIRYYEAVQEKNIPAEMHLYQQGGHGFIFKQKDWIEPLFQWMRMNKWIDQ